MQPKTDSLRAAGFFSLFIMLGILLVSCGDWVMPKTLVGTWSTTQKITVRFKAGMFSYRFASSAVPVNIVMNIHEDGTVEGSVGEAKWEGCSVVDNRGWWEKTTNSSGGYIIIGKLTGNIFAQDTLAAKEIKMPFHLKDNMMAGTLFQKQGMGVFPMVNVHLSKQ